MERFETANLTIQEVADAMGMDTQSIRVMIRENLVPWGTAIKKPGSTKYTYLISPVKFYEATGWKKNVESEE